MTGFQIFLPNRCVSIFLIFHMKLGNHMADEMTAWFLKKKICFDHKQSKRAKNKMAKKAQNDRFSGIPA